MEVLLPNGVLTIGNDVGAGDSGIGDLDGDIGVACHFSVGLAADGEELADPLGEHVLVGEVLGVVHPNVEAAVEQHHFQRRPHAAML